MGFPKDDPRQLPHQGALLCQDWPGPYAWKGPIPDAHYFSAEDLASSARLKGGISFHYACFGAGTPRVDDFAQRLSHSPEAIAAHAFVARLPQRQLAHPAGGLLAVIGHVERAWGYSFVWRNAGSQLAVFESAIRRLMAGYPVGYAMEYFNARYAELSTVISSEMLGAGFGKLVDQVELAGMWTANNDARSYVILGDPAVRLRLRPLAEVAAGRPAPAVIDVGATGASAPPEAVIARIRATGSLETALQALRDAPQQPDLLALLGDLLAGASSGNRLENLTSAVSIYQAALQAGGPDDPPDLRAEVRRHLAEALCEQYAWTGKKRHALQAEAAILQALASLQAQSDPPGRGELLTELAYLYARRSRREKDGSLAHKAIQTFNQALELTPRLHASFEWAAIHQALGVLEAELFSAGGDEGCRERAVGHLQAASEVFTPELFPDRHADLQRRLVALADLNKKGGEI
jgi:tetratricopeptide (TPR) repeat protein